MIAEITTLYEGVLPEKDGSQNYPWQSISQFSEKRRRVEGCRYGRKNVFGISNERTFT